MNTRSPNWKDHPELWLPFLFFVLMQAYACTLGLTDDEAYYWVLAQKPALGYAYHPPAVAWLIAGVQAVLGPVIGTHRAGLVRLPGILCVTAVLWLGLRWVRDAAGVPADSRPRYPLSRPISWRIACVPLAFAALFSLSWMMVPDLPLFLGWTVAFTSTWEACQSEGRSGAWGIAAGCALGMLSKYSGVLIGLSAATAIGIYVPRSRWLRLWGAVAAGSALGAAPAILWNAQHEWVSILYQVRDRHGGGISPLRWGRFWATQIVLAGPGLLAYALGVLPRAVLGRPKEGWRSDRVSVFAWIWMAPALLIYGLQPLLGDFKPHWALIAWWPAVLAFAASGARGERKSWIGAHLAYGAVLSAMILACCEWPLIGWASRTFAKGPVDPRTDVTNDLYGWKDLGSFLDRKLAPDLRGLPVVGSRYQTAAQALFALGEKNPGTLLPQSIKDRDEWPNLDITEGKGPEWPRLKSAILYIRDNRFDATPGFPNARCEVVGKLEAFRFSVPAKWIEISRCQPEAVRP